MQTIGEVDQTKPLQLQADELVYDNENGIVSAVGRVEIFYNNFSLVADKVIYDQKANTLVAEGNVRIKEPDGAVVSADRITLTDDFRDGFIGSLQIVTKDDTRIAAAEAKRIDGETNEFTSASFTPCKPCRSDDPNSPPLWRIRAGKIIHKQGEGNIYYEDAAFELFGVPIAYVPFFSHADPSVKRRTGFVSPTFGYSGDLGYTTDIPYFWAIAPNMDFTFTPRITSRQGVLMQGEWRHRLEDGTYSVKLAGIADEDPSASQDFRGSLESKGLFDLGSWWQFGWDGVVESDDTFRRFYKLDDVIRTDRVNQAFLVGMSDRNYLGTYLYHFGGLLLTDDSTSELVVRPVIDYNYILDMPLIGGELRFGGNAMVLNREDGIDSSRAIGEIAWRRQIIDPFGQVFTPFAQARADIYSIADSDGSGGIPAGSSEVGRAYALAGLQYQYPFVAHSDYGSHVIEPIAQIIARPDRVEQDGVPNEDAQSMEFDDTLLFDIDKFSGYDRVETGVRANVGLQYTLQLDNGGYMRALFGQSYHLDGDNPFIEDRGLATDSSDIVTGIYLSPSVNYWLLSQARFDQSDFSVRRIDASVGANLGYASGTVSYARATEADAGGGPDKLQEEMQADGRVAVTERWALLGGVRFDVDAELALSHSLGIQYSDECFALTVTYKETEYENADISPDETVMVRFDLKYLGSFGTSDLVGDISPNADH